MGLRDKLPGNWRLMRDSSLRLTLENHDAPASIYAAWADALSAHMGLETRTPAIQSEDQIFQDHGSPDGAVVGMEWDSRDGFMVVAKNAEGRELVRKLAEELEAKEAPDHGKKS